MIPSMNRFHGYYSLKAVYSYGKTSRGAFFSIKSLNNPKRRKYRAAVVVSRKVNKSAVARNKIRRRLYALLREFSADFHQAPDIVITVYSDKVLELNHKKLSEDLKKQLKQNNII